MCNGGWCHLTSKDLLRWTAQNETAAHGNPLANGDTGSISFTEKGTVALFPTTRGPLGLMRQVPSGGGGGLSAGVTWTNATKVFAATFDGARAGFRDPARAVKMSDGNYYVAVGAGVGKEGCIAWLKAADASLSSFSFTGCLLSTNHTTGHMESHHYGWDKRDQTVTFIECPDGTCSSALCVFSRQAPRTLLRSVPAGRHRHVRGHWIFQQLQPPYAERHDLSEQRVLDWVDQRQQKVCAHEPWCTGL